MNTKSEFDQERFNLVLGFELRLCRIKLRKCIMQRNAVFLGKSFFYEYAFVLIKRRTGFLTTFKRDCPINFFLQRHRIEFMRKPIKSVKLLTDHKQNCNCEMPVEMNVTHFFQTTELCIRVFMKTFALTITVSIALRSMNMI